MRFGIQTPILKRYDWKTRAYTRFSIGFLVWIPYAPCDWNIYLQLIQNVGRYSSPTVDGSEIRLTSWYVVNPITYKVLSPSQGGYLGFLPFLQYGAFGNGKVKLESTTSLHRLLCKGVLQNLPSRELTYPPTMAYLKMIFLFPRWDMLVPWRVFFLDGVSNDHPCGSFKASKMMVVFNDFLVLILRRTRIANPVKGIVSVFKLAGKLVLLGVNFYSKCRHIFIYIIYMDPMGFKLRGGV